MYQVKHLPNFVRVFEMKLTAIDFSSPIAYCIFDLENVGLDVRMRSNSKGVRLCHVPKKA